MPNTFLQVLPLALGGAVNVLGILIIFFLLSRPEKALIKTWIFIAGSVSFLVFVVFVEKFLLKDTLGASHHSTKYSAIIDIVLGISLILLAIFRKSKQKVSSKKNIGLWGNFVFGFVFMITDFSTLILYFSALKIVFLDKLSFWQNAVLIAVTIIITMSTMALPVFLATVMPKKSAKMLNTLQYFINKYGSKASKIIIVIIAIYLISKGVMFFY